MIFSNEASSVDQVDRGADVDHRDMGRAGFPLLPSRNVENAVAYAWSNGPVEGHINRLKAVKLQMYGRAGFKLLRARILPLAA
jgi:hypothetical protein